MFVVFKNTQGSDYERSFSMFSLPTRGYDIKEVRKYDVRGRIYKVAVDLHNQMIYVVNHTKPYHATIVRFDYAGNNMMVLYENDHVWIETLDVFNGSIVWSDYLSITTYICKPNPTCTGQNMYESYTDNIPYVSI